MHRGGAHPQHPLGTKCVENVRHHTRADLVTVPLFADGDRPELDDAASRRWNDHRGACGNLIPTGAGITEGVQIALIPAGRDLGPDTSFGLAKEPKGWLPLRSAGQRPQNQPVRDFNIVG
jgi:hypothetical protein